MSVGADLRKMMMRPDYARPDIYNTKLLYRNLVTDSVVQFEMNTIPKDSSWVFENSSSELVSRGFRSPLEGFKIEDMRGEEISADLINHPGDLCIIFVNEPQFLDADILNKINNLSILSASMNQSPVSFYASTGLNREQLTGFSDSFISPVYFYSGDPEFIKSVAGNGIVLLRINDGRIIQRWDNNEIPQPDIFESSFSLPVREPEFESLMVPVILGKYYGSIEGKDTLIAILVLVLSLVLIRIYRNIFFSGKK
jgi:hypothetical protein